LTADSGLLVFFSGNKFYHAVTALSEGEGRIVFAIEYGIDHTAGIYKRSFSNFRDVF
jgi:hypothetical protein